MRFVQGYREAVDWMYADPKATKLYAEKMKLDETLIADSIKEFHPKAAMQTDEMQDMEGIQRDAVKLIITLREDFLAPASSRRVLLRLCSNLHQIYLQLKLNDKTTRLQRYLVALAR